MWGFTGAHFELKQVSDLWYAVLPGQGADEREIESKPLPGRAVSMDQAAAIARRTVPDGRLVSVSVLDRKKTSAYLVWLSRGNDTYDHGVFPGNVGVTIDRYSGKATVTYPTQADPPPVGPDRRRLVLSGARGHVRQRLVASALAGARPRPGRAGGHRRMDVADPPGQAAAQAPPRRGRRGMSESLAQTVALYAAGLTVFSLVTAVRGRGIGRLRAAGCVVLGAGAALDAIVATVGMAAGARPAEPVPFCGYLLLSVVAVPVGWRYARAAGPGWDAAALALATGALGVICVRLGRTWG
jgi:hypothetical protein